MDLEHRFNQLAKEYTQDSRQVKVLWNELYNAHHESHRTYHNMRHLQELFRYVDQYKHQLASVEAVSFAVFYHDSVYKLTSKKMKNSVLSWQKSTYQNKRSEALN